MRTRSISGICKAPLTKLDSGAGRKYVTIKYEAGSAQYSSAPSITTVCSNYQTSYNDFFEIYITETVTLSPNIQMVLLTSSVPFVYQSTMSHNQSFFVLIG